MTTKKRVIPPPVGCVCRHCGQTLTSDDVVRRELGRGWCHAACLDRYREELERYVAEQRALGRVIDVALPPLKRR